MAFQDGPDVPASRGVPGRPALSAQAAVESLAGAPAVETVLGLVELLGKAGAPWEGALVLLGPAAGRPSGVGEVETVARLRKGPETLDKVSGLTYTLWAEFRAYGSAVACQA